MIMNERAAKNGFARSFRAVAKRQQWTRLTAKAIGTLDKDCKYLLHVQAAAHVHSLSPPQLHLSLSLSVFPNE